MSNPPTPAQVAAYLTGALGEAQFGAVSRALCSPPCNTCLRVNTLRTSTQEVLQHVLSVAEAAAASTSTPGPSTATGVPQPYVHPKLPVVIMPGRGPVQIDYSKAGEKGRGLSVTFWLHHGTQAESHRQEQSDRSSTPFACNAGGKEVVISRKAGEAVLRGAPIYAPGVIACSSGVEEGDLVAVSVVLERPGG